MQLVLTILIVLNVLALHCSIAGMEIFSWTLFGVIVGYKIYRRDRFDWPVAVPLFLLTAIVGVSLLLNDPLKPFWFQFGFMRWIFLVYGFHWTLTEIWSREFEAKLLPWWNFAIVAAGLYAMAQAWWGIDPVHPGVQVVQFENWGTYHGTGYFAMKATGFFTLSLTYAYVTGISMMSVGGPSFLARPKALGWGARLVGIGGIFASMSRGAWISFLLCEVLTAARYYLKWFLLTLGGGAVLALIAFFVHQGFHDHVMAFRLDHSSMMRVDIWRGYLGMVMDHPWFGIGLLQGDLLLPEYYARLGIEQKFVSHAHNVYLQWAAGAGVFSLVVYLWLCIEMLRKAWRLSYITHWGWPLVLGQLFMHFGAFTECNFFDGEVNHMLVFAWAIVLTLEGKQSVLSKISSFGVQK